MFCGEEDEFPFDRASRVHARLHLPAMIEPELQLQMTAAKAASNCCTLIVIALDHAPTRLAPKQP